jgi:hypothetical protein
MSIVPKTLIHREKLSMRWVFEFTYEILEECKKLPPGIKTAV